MLATSTASRSSGWPAGRAGAYVPWASMPVCVCCYAQYSCESPVRRKSVSMVCYQTGLTFCMLLMSVF